MNRLNKPKDSNLPPLRPHKGVVAELQFFPKIDKNGNLILDQQLRNYFDTPEALEEYIKEQKIRQKKIKNYEKWLSAREWQTTQNKENYPSRNIWNGLVQLIADIYKDGLYYHFEDRIFELAKKIILRGD